MTSVFKADSFNVHNSVINAKTGMVQRFCLDSMDRCAVLERNMAEAGYFRTEVEAEARTEELQEHNS